MIPVGISTSELSAQLENVLDGPSSSDEESYEERVARRLVTEQDVNRSPLKPNLQTLPVEYLLRVCVDAWRASGDVKHLRRAVALLETVVEIEV
jgi:hypothetical protein